LNSLEKFQDSTYYQQFLSYLKEKYPDEYSTFTGEQIQSKFEDVFMVGLNKHKEFLSTNKSCNLLYKEKPPRADMVATLGNILFELQKLQSYPIVPPLRVSQAVKKILSNKDKRTQKKHLEWIIKLANFQNQFNTVDLTNITRQYPEDKIVERKFWQ